MGLELKKLGDTLIVRVHGEFDLGAAGYCRKEIDKKVRTEGIKDIIFDLEGVTFIDSSGLGLILGRYRIVKENGGRVVISNAEVRIVKILDLSGINRLIPVYPSTSQALRYLARGVV